MSKKDKVSLKALDRMATEFIVECMLHSNADELSMENKVTGEETPIPEAFLEGIATGARMLSLMATGEMDETEAILTAFALYARNHEGGDDDDE